MRVEEKKQWHAIYTRPKWEKKVAEQLAKKKIEVYCPVNRVPRQWADRKKVMPEPLFKSYVFARITPREYANIRQVDGVINLVYWLNRPAVIRGEEIDTIKHFLNEYDHVSTERVDVSPTEKVRIINGPLMMWEGNVVEIKTNTVKITLPSLGFSLIAEIKTENLETIRPMREVHTRVI